MQAFYSVYILRKCFPIHFLTFSICHFLLFLLCGVLDSRYSERPPAAHPQFSVGFWGSFTDTLWDSGSRRVPQCLYQDTERKNTRKIGCFSVKGNAWMLKEMWFSTHLFQFSFRRLFLWHGQGTFSKNNQSLRTMFYSTCEMSVIKRWP